MATVATTEVVDDATARLWLEPRDDLVLERSRGSGRFEAVEGPFAAYRRTVVLEHLPDGRVAVTSTTDFELALPYFGWVFLLPVRRALGRRPRRGGRQPWWAPPDRLDARASTALGVLCAVAYLGGYLSTLITQTLTFVADEMGAGDRTQGYALASVRAGVLLALVLVTAADRRGRRRLIVACASGAIAAAVASAAAPTLAAFTGAQVVQRACTTTLAILVGIVAAEEMPRSSRAYAISVLAMAGALGAGLAVLALPLADVGDRGWRVLFVIPLLGIPLVRGVARRLPESRRFRAPHAEVRFGGHGRRLLLLAGSALLLSLFTTPASQFQNEFLRDERGYSASRISLFTLLTNTPGAIGIIVGGRLADVRGRRIVGAVALAGGVGATVLMFQSTGWPLWAWSVVGAIIGAATVPALGVYGPELFPTSLRGRANGVIALLGVTGSGLGLLATGILSDRLDGLPDALTLMALGPAVLVIVVLLAYPETAHRELEDLNPEDEPPPHPLPQPLPPGG